MVMSQNPRTGEGTSGVRNKERGNNDPHEDRGRNHSKRNEGGGRREEASTRKSITIKAASSQHLQPNVEFLLAPRSPLLSAHKCATLDEAHG